jgi:predicted MFS family arabinose efflux permease
VLLNSILASGMVFIDGTVVNVALIEHVSWRYAFLVNLPFVLAVLFLSLRHVPESRGEDAAARLDWGGAALASIGLGALVYGLIESPVQGWRSPPAAAAIVLAPLALGAFILVERRHPAPLLPLHLFRARDFAAANVLTLLLYAALGALMFYLPLNLIQVQGYSATLAGAALLPFVLVMFALSRWTGGLVDRYGARGPLVAGPLIAAFGFVLLALPGVSVGYWTGFLPAVLVLGLGMAVTVAPLTTTVMNALDPVHVGLASGVNNAVSRAAGLLAMAVLGIVMGRLFDGAMDARTAHLPAPVRAQVAAQRDKLAALRLPDAAPPAQQAVQAAVASSFVDGFRWVAGIAALLAAGGALCARRMVANAPRT